MTKDKKFSGDCVFINDDESLFATVSRNTVYVHSIETRKTIFKAKTLSNADCAAVSPDKNLLAVKNTSGTLALYDMKSGEELCRDDMERTEGEPMFFTSSGKHIIDLDWGGRTMHFDCVTKSHSILDNARPLFRCDFIQYDRFTKKIYRFMANGFGYGPGIVQTTRIDENNLSP
ncbi:MAG: WD40 repeat domain-containing protein, partial [Treponema sp.]|nr:WD40 repeat domain-containing protein [Treponema sp.]